MILLFNIQQNLTAIGAGFLRFLFWWQKPAIVIILHATLTLMIDKILNHQILSEKNSPLMKIHIANNLCTRQQ